MKLYHKVVAMSSSNDFADQRLGIAESSFVNAANKITSIFGKMICYMHWITFTYGVVAPCVAHAQQERDIKQVNFIL